MSQTDLIGQFIASVVVAAATAEIVPRDPDRISDAVLRAAGEEGAIFLAEAGDVSSEIFDPLRRNIRVVTRPSRDQMRTIRVGVTDAFCGVASTGSVCVSIDGSLSGPASALTRSHIVVVDGTTIVPRPRDLFSEEYLGGKGLGRSFSFITGPSATADMGPLVRGVHGPGKLHVIVVE